MDIEKKIRLVIWGTGGQAGAIINYNKGWLINVKIVCFISNSHQLGKEEQFYKKDVLSPSELNQLEYDYILILSSYVKEIKEQIVNELHIQKNKIISLESLAKKVVEQMGINIIDKKILLYGKRYTDFNYIYHVQQRVQEMRIVIDKDNERINTAPGVCIEDISDGDYDYILLIEHNDKERNELCLNLENNGIQLGQNVLCLSQWIANLAYEFQINNNTSKELYYAIVPRPHDGLMGLFFEYLRACDYANEKGYIPFIDMQNASNFYLEEDEFGKVNSWEKFYSQTLCAKDKSIIDIYQRENVIIPSMFVKINRYRDVVKNRDSLETMKKLYHKYFLLKNDIRENIEKKYAVIFKDVKGQSVLGCIYRGTDYINVKPANHMIQPEIDEFIEICDKKRKEWKCDFVFLATEDADALEKCKEYFGNKLLFTDQIRYSNTGNKFLVQIHNDRKNDRYLRGIEYLTALILLSKTNYLVSGQNGGLDGVLLLKDGDFKEMYIFDKGKYAVTNSKYI